MIAVLIAHVWYGVTFFAIMILAALQWIPDELYEAAALDGAGKVRTFFQITIPCIRITLAPPCCCGSSGSSTSPT